MELKIENPDHRLKPGMFIRATLVLERAAEANIVPKAALTERNDQTGVFVLDASTQTVSWQVVKPGIQEDQRVQILEPELTGSVITLGQQMLDQGSSVIIPGKSSSPTLRSRESAPE